MLNLDENLLQFIKRRPKLLKDFFSGHFGLEKENLRTTPKGHLALTPHPTVFGPKEDNPFIKTDFSESQIEMVTPTCDSIDEAYGFLTNLHRVVSLSLENEELLWPNSNPPYLPEDEKDIPTSVFQNKNTPNSTYREYLAQKYGKKRQLLSGIHYNFSFTDSFLRTLFEGYNKSYGNYRDFKNSVYLKIARYFLKNRWLFVYLTGGSPVYLGHFIKTPSETKIAPDVLSMDEGVSLRNSSYGYKNKNSLFIDYSSFEGYLHSLAKHVQSGAIKSLRELYEPIRLKNGSSTFSLENLAKEGVDYMEFRSIDLNPLEKIGVSKETLYFIHLFFITGLLTNDDEGSADEQINFNTNEEITAQNGLNHPDIVTGRNGEKENFVSAGLRELNKMFSITEQLAKDKPIYQQTLTIQKERLINRKKTIAAEVIKGVRQAGYISYHIEIAKKAREHAAKKAYQLAGAKDLELSTQIILNSALKKGIPFEILDRSENFVRFLRKGQTEYVKQATKTSKDTYIVSLLMENKLVTKQILKENGMPVPDGESFANLEKAIKAYEKFRHYEIVVKPKTSNYGVGVSIFKGNFTKNDYVTAVKAAFSEDKSILVENYIPGEEHRFFVLDGQVAAAMKRIPANVIGDGIHTVSELIDKKNNNPLRGTNYVTPLEKIRKGREESLMLSTQKMTWESIPLEGQTIYLRDNSNISIGGDSIDVTHTVDRYYNLLACKAANAIGAKICGVDIIIPKQPKEYNKAAIIELNFNPAIHIHCFPSQGERRMLGDKILDFLFAEDK